MKRFKNLLFIMLMFLLWIPIIQQYTAYFNEPKLNGAFVIPAKPNFSTDSLASFKYQTQLEDYLNNTFGFRGLLVKIKNSLEYKLWKEIPVADNIEGENGVIFSKGSIERFIGNQYNGKEKNEATIERINFLKNDLKKYGGHLLVVMAPSKESVMTGAVPSIYHDQFKNRNDFIDMIDGYKKYDIPYIDFCSYFRKINDTSRFPLFTKTGFHWSTYGSAVAHDSLIRKISQFFDKTIPSYSWEGMEWSDTAREGDNDFEGPMNFLFKLDNSRFVYPKFKMIESTRKNFRPKVIIIGDSFFWTLKSRKMMMNIFSEDSKFWFYFATTSFPIGDVAGVPLKDINIMNELQSADLVLLVGSVGTLNTFPFGVTDYYYDHLSPLGGLFNSISEYIKTSPTLLKKLTKEAYRQNKPLDQVITSEAKRLINEKPSFNLIAKNGKYVCADQAIKNELIADRDNAWGWETFTLICVDSNQFVIRSSDESFLHADVNNKNKITATQKSISNQEVFSIIKFEKDVVAFKASNGKYLSFDEKSQGIFANANTIGEKEKFRLIYK